MTFTVFLRKISQFNHISQIVIDRFSSGSVEITDPLRTSASQLKDTIDVHIIG